MSRIRTIKPTFWEDEKIAQLTIPTRLFFIGIWNFADDEGTIIWRPEYLRSRVFPYDDLSLESVRQMQGELSTTNLMYPYKVSNENYAVILTFKKHQNINRPLPSKLPAPNWEDSAYIQAILKRDHFTCVHCGLVFDSVSPTTLEDLTVHYRVSRPNGGNNFPGNVIAICKRCTKLITNDSVSAHPWLTDPSVPEEEKENRKEEEGEVRVKVKEEEEKGNALSVISKAYETNIGILTPMIADSLRDAVTQYPERWITEAMELACKNNKRRWSYIAAILENWKRDGKGNGHKSLNTPTRSLIDVTGIGQAHERAKQQQPAK